MFNIKKISKGYFRKGKYSVSLIPMREEDTHPVFHSHCNILQPLTSNLLPWKTLHVINRLPKHLSFFNKSYIAEVEGATGIAPTSITKYGFDLKKCHNFIDNEIKQNKLKKIVFFSESSLDLQRQWMTDRMIEISDFSNIAPHKVFQKSLDLSVRKLSFIIVISQSVNKGSFLFPLLIDEIIKRRQDVVFNIVTAEDFVVDDRHCRYINKYVIKRMSFSQKKDIFFKSDILINVSPMDTLGSFLDSMMFNTPVITVPGQHAHSYIKHNLTGYIVDSPIFYYSDAWGKEYFNAKKDFREYLLKMDLSCWNVMLKQIGDIVEDLNFQKISKMMSAQHKDTIQNHNLSDWLDKWESIYKEV